MAPAIRLAAEGFVLDQGDVDILSRSAESFAAEPNVAAVFLKDGKTFSAGDRLVQANLAATLKSIAKDGPDAFYRGSIADRIVAPAAPMAAFSREGFRELHDLGGEAGALQLPQL